MAITREDVARLEMNPLSRSHIRKSMCVLGVGGVGSNIVRTAVDLENQLKLHIYDFDSVERHNLNRSSLFGVNEVINPAITSTYRLKTEIVARRAINLSKMLYRTNIPKITVATRHTKVNPAMTLPRGTVIDARDTMDPTKMHARSWLKMAYDGGSNIGFTFLPYIVAEKVIDLSGGRTNSYEITPSFYVPAAILGVMGFRFMQYPNFTEITNLRAGTCSFDIDTLIDDVSYAWEGV